MVGQVMGKGHQRIGMIGPRGGVDRMAHAACIDLERSAREMPAFMGHAAGQLTHEAQPALVQRPEPGKAHDLGRRAQRGLGIRYPGDGAFRRRVWRLACHGAGPSPVPGAEWTRIAGKANPRCDRRAATRDMGVDAAPESRVKLPGTEQGQEGGRRW